jgi:hypothetical protein
LAGGAQLGRGQVDPQSGVEPAQRRQRGHQLLARGRRSPGPAQLLAVEQLGAGVVERRAGPGVQRQRLAVVVLGLRDVLGDQGATA